MAHVTTRAATADDFDEIVEFDARAFGSEWKPELLEPLRPTLEMDRFRLAHDGSTLVGVAGVSSKEITVPGGTQVAAGGVTWVGVATTHRRRGILSTLLDELHGDIDGRCEAISMLTASEGGIYERFGYGIASQRRIIEIDRRRAQIRPECRPAPGEVMMTSPDDPRLVELFDAYRRQRNGEVDRSEAQFTLDRAEIGAGLAVAIHADGFAAWKVTSNWKHGHPEHGLELFTLIATTARAHAALWHTVLSVDLVGPISSMSTVSLDDALPDLLTDQRALRTTNLNDMVWLHLRDVKRALSARTYGADDELVVEVDLGERSERWLIEGSPDGADVKRARRRADLTMSRAALGAIYLGGVRPSTLARAGRLSAADQSVIRRADNFFAAERLPHCSTGF